MDLTLIIKYTVCKATRFYLGTMPTMPQHNEKEKEMKMKTELQTSNFKDEVNARMQRMKGKHGGWW